MPPPSALWRHRFPSPRCLTGLVRSRGQNLPATPRAEQPQSFSAVSSVQGMPPDGDRTLPAPAGEQPADGRGPCHPARGHQVHPAQQLSLAPLRAVGASGRRAGTQVLARARNRLSGTAGRCRRGREPQRRSQLFSLLPAAPTHPTMF